MIALSIASVRDSIVTGGMPEIIVVMPDGDNGPCQDLVALLDSTNPTVENREQAAIPPRFGGHTKPGVWCGWRA